MFLDEIHRLPPEVKKWFFILWILEHIINLGNDKTRKQMYCDNWGHNWTQFYLLNTFIRRIPITITIPAFDERSIDEKLELVQYLFSKEAQRVNKAIRISSEAIKALIGSTTYGNVGQLKSNIQLVCAKGFFNSVNTDKNIEINLTLLPPNIKSGILAFGNQTGDNTTMWNMMPNSITIQPDGNKTFLETDDYKRHLTFTA